MKYIKYFIIFSILSSMGFASDTYLDRFETVSYTNSDGTLDWSSKAWTESNDDDNANDGSIKIKSNQLYFDKITENMSIEREVDLNISFTIDINLSFDFDKSEIGDSKLKIELCENSSCHKIGTIDGNSASPFNYQLTADERDNVTKIRFSSDSGDWGTHGFPLSTKDQLYIDNVKFELFFDRDGDGVLDKDDIDDDNDGILDADEGNIDFSNLHKVLHIPDDTNTSFISDTEVQLTPDKNNQRGAINSQKTIDITRDFVMEYELYFGDDDGGADGIAFVLHNDSRGADAIGYDPADVGGVNIGAYGINNGISIEFDTYKNDSGSEDTDEDHTQIRDTDYDFTDTNGKINDVSTLDADNIEDGDWHQVRLEWNATTETITYYFDGQEFSYDFDDISHDYFNGATKVYYALTASTGGATNDQRVRELNYHYLNNDTDGDGIPDYQDLDSDNDGIPDNIEAQSTKDYIAPTGNDTDSDGLDDAYDEDDSGTPVSLPDSDKDGKADFVDTDSDNDGYSDCEEGNKNHDCSTINIAINGMPEWEANGADYSDVNGNIDEPDPDDSGDLIDRISNNDEAAYRELLCGKSNFQLTKDQWRMISIPCDTGTNSIKTLFGGVLGDYDDNWVMYKQTGDDNYETNSSHKNTNKTKLTEDDTLTVGISYWIITDDDHTLNIDETLSGLSPTTTVSKDSISISDNAFDKVHEANLPANSANNVKKFMAGNPLPFRFDFSKLYFKNENTDYKVMGDSNNDSYILARIYTHDSSDESDKNVSDGGGYTVIAPQTPGLSKGQVVPMEGFFIQLEKQSDEKDNKFAYPLMQQYGN